MSSTSLRQRLALQVLTKRKRLNTGGAQGFTLIELLVVVIILGVLAAIAVPPLLNQQGRARINAAQTAAMDAARGCAAAQVTDEQASFVVPANITAAPGCPATGTVATFTPTATDFNVTTAPVATVGANGGVNLTTCAAAQGWTAGTAPSCKPTRTP